MMPAGVIPSEEPFTKPRAHTDVSMCLLLLQSSCSMQMCIRDRDMRAETLICDFHKFCDDLNEQFRRNMIVKRSNLIDRFLWTLQDALRPSRRCRPHRMLRLCRRLPPLRPSRKTRRRKRKTPPSLPTRTTSIPRWTLSLIHICVQYPPA